MSQDPVSWLMIESGWTAVGSDGEEVGRVEEVVGDSSHDIWDGLSIAPSMLARPKYVAAEQVAAIEQGRVTLSLTKAQFDALGEYEEPPTTAEVEPEQAPLGTRLESGVEARTRTRAEHAPLVHRVLRWLGLKRD